MEGLAGAEGYFEEKYKNDSEFQEAWDEIELAINFKKGVEVLLLT